MGEFAEGMYYRGLGGGGVIRSKEEKVKDLKLEIDKTTEEIKALKEKIWSLQKPKMRLIQLDLYIKQEWLRDKEKEIEKLKDNK